MDLSRAANMTGLSFRSCSYLRRSAARYCRHRGLKGDEESLWRYEGT